MSYEGNDWRTAIAEPKQTTRAADLAKQPNVLPIYASSWPIASASVVQNVNPARPVVCLCLGPDDRSGGFVIESDEVGPQRFATVSPGAPWFGRLTQPFRVWPLIRATLVGLTNTTTLNALAFYELPPVVPLRAQMIVRGELNYTGGGTTIEVCTVGRRRVRVVTDAPSASADVRILGYAFANTAFVQQEWCGGAAVTANMFYEWDPTQAYPSAANNQRGMSSPDMVAIAIATVGRSVQYSIEAWDY